MASLRRRLLGAALLAAAAAAFGVAATVAPVIVPEAGTASGNPDLVVPSPVSLLAAPALLAVGSVLLVSGGATLLDADLSARAALLAPALGAVVALALGTGIGTDFGAPLAAFAASEALATLSAGPPGTIAAGAVAGATVAPVVRAATTEDTVTLLVGATLLLASVAAASADPLALATGGVAGALAVGALWAVDPATWRP
ncbi:hypothetical protein [Halorubrum lipolyticum]|uniref:Uncharacterized protein n=1 Tax=Halorubrum lipolyticum DSM 21995 TaxID=1227482 RepID=M0NU99_9EURY|nr:hypothetical protein [Halorubrum lipolyticum]EMA60185.1 hypothetical protein C469_08955 [Halorubrum lipolyticum DSM 21995]